MAADPSPENVGYIGTVISALGGIGATVYLIWRKLRGDKLADVIDTKSQQLINNLTSRLQAEEEKTKRLENSIERVAKERNEAVQALGRLEERIKQMETIVALLKRDNDTLRTDITGLRRDNQRLIEQIGGLRRELGQGE